MDTFSIFQHQINLGANVLVQVPYFQVSILTRFTGTEQVNQWHENLNFCVKL